MVYHYHKYCFLKKINTINTKCACETMKNECTKYYNISSKFNMWKKKNLKTCRFESQVGLT